MSKIVGFRLEGFTRDLAKLGDRNGRQAEIGADIDVGAPPVAFEKCAEGAIGLECPVLVPGITGDDGVIRKRAFDQPVISHDADVAYAVSPADRLKQAVA